MDDDISPQAASLKVLHAVNDAPAVHVNYFGINDVTFSNNPTLSFGVSSRYSIPKDRPRNIKIVNSQDTTSVLTNIEVNLPAGNISTLFLTGRDNDIRALLIEDLLLKHKDSTAGFRFINLSPDSESLIFEADQGLSPISLGFEEVLAFQEVDATVANGNYNFEIKDVGGNVLTTYSTTAPVFRNTTLAIIGLSDDGAGGNSLQVIRVDSF